MAERYRHRDRQFALPTGHRVFRIIVLLVLALTTVQAGRANGVATATHWTIHQAARVTYVIWRPLLHGDGWVKPLLPKDDKHKRT